jgi:hypothetical protein
MRKVLWFPVSSPVKLFARVLLHKHSEYVPLTSEREVYLARLLLCNTFISTHIGYMHIYIHIYSYMCECVSVCVCLYVFESKIEFDFAALFLAVMNVAVY